MFESGDPSFEMVHNGSGELVTKSDLDRPIINFSKSILGLAGPYFTINKTI